jgi:SagB-type dehydrogenase family enzyme
MREGDPTELLVGACHYHESLQQAALVVAFTAVLERTKRKYGERGYRYALIEAGHVAQNLCLAAGALGLACMTVCGFFDDKLNDLFGLDGVDETSLYVAYLGRQSKQ